MSTNNNVKQMSKNKQRIKAKQEQKRIGMSTYINEGQLNLRVKLSMQEYERLKLAATISGVHMRECLKRGISLYHDFIMRAYEKHQTEVKALKEKQNEVQIENTTDNNSNVEVDTNEQTGGKSESLNTEGVMASEQSSLSDSTAS
jgi:uncharacterized cupredoxin-like copper-binding protein